VVAPEEGLVRKPTATLAGLRTYAPLVANFAGRELKARYRRSLLGWTWSLLSPLSTIVVYSLVFSVFLKVDPDPAGNGDKNFALFLFSGLVVWLFFSGMITGSMDWLSSVGDLRRKVYFPPEAAIFGSAAALGVQSAIEIGVLLGAMIAIGNVGLPSLLLPLVLIFAGLFGLGLGFFVTVANTHYRDVQYLVGIILNAAFFLVPIVYPMNIIPERHWGLPVRKLIEYNPVNQFVAAARDCVYFVEWPSAGRWLAMVGYSVATFLVGWRFFSRRSMDLSEEM
jgi:ABC-type polysaccharide/polyol phosphate export permease